MPRKKKKEEEVENEEKEKIKEEAEKKVEEKVYIECNNCGKVIECNKKDSAIKCMAKHKWRAVRIYNIDEQEIFAEVYLCHDCGHEVWIKFLKDEKAKEWIK
jgi:hypothetical protein